MIALHNLKPASMSINKAIVIEVEAIVVKELA